MSVCGGYACPAHIAEVDGVSHLHLILGIVAVGCSFALGYGRGNVRKRHLPWQWLSTVIQTARHQWEPALPEEFDKLDLYVEKFLTDLGLRQLLPVARRNNLDYNGLLTLGHAEICRLLELPPDEISHFHEFRDALVSLRELARSLGHFAASDTDLRGKSFTTYRSNSQPSLSSFASLQSNSQTSVELMCFGGDAVDAAAAGQRRIVSVGDLHGDYASTELILMEMGIMGEHGEWIGGDTILVQTGDICDRGDNSGDIYRALFRLQDEAPSQGGEVILLFGNHDILNLAGEFDFAGEDETASLAGEGGMDGSLLSGDEHAARSRAFAPDGWLGRELRLRGQAAALVGLEYGFSQPVLFVHGGLLPRTVGMLQSWCLAALEDLDGPEPQATNIIGVLNSIVRTYLAGSAEEVSSFVNSNEEPCRELFGESGPFWCRELSLGDEGPMQLQATLNLLGASRMVVGHTPQANGEVRHWYGGRLVLTDTLISAAYTGTAHPSALEIASDGVASAVYPTRKLRVELPTPGMSPRASQPCMASQSSSPTSAASDDLLLASVTPGGRSRSRESSVSLPIVVACAA